MSDLEERYLALVRDELPAAREAGQALTVEWSPSAVRAWIAALRDHSADRSPVPRVVWSGRGATAGGCGGVAHPRRESIMRG